MRIVLDCNCLCHISKHAMGDLAYNFQDTGVIFGFLKHLLTLSKIFPTPNFVFVWDSPSGYLRSKIYPEYKGNRKIEDKEPRQKEFDDKSYEQFGLLRTNILPKLGFRNILVADGFEADDLIASTALNAGEIIVIVSTDHDLFQLLSSRVSIFNPRSKKHYTARDFIEEWGIVPSVWSQVKAMAGDLGDNVKGVENVGIITAIKYLKNQLKYTTKAYKRITLAKAEGLVELNTKLVKLPFEGTPILPLVDDHLNMGSLIQVCTLYGLNSLITKDMMDDWQRGVGFK